MPRGRFLSKSISLDEKVNALSDDTARLLFTWLIAHLDCEGRLHGDATTVKSIIFPRRNISVKRIDKYLNEIQRKGLIFRYSINGNTYLSAPNFEKHQMGLQKSKEAQSQIPPPTPELIQSSSKRSTAQGKAKDKVKAEAKDILAQKNTTSEQFEAFWDLYPKKKSKGQAEKAFEKLNPGDQLLKTILTAIEAAKKSADWLKDDGQFIPYPATWLNAKGWEDELPKEGKGGTDRKGPTSRELPKVYRTPDELFKDKG